MDNRDGRKLYSIGEYYRIIFLFFLSISDYRKSKTKEILDEHFVERIMLAVTEVNGCEICSYAHTKMALEAGMSNEEIQNMLAGIKDDIPEDEISAVLFAQHYADTRSYPSKDSWERIEEVYGQEKAKGVLASIRMIMFGNAAGVAWSSFFNRFKRKADPRSNLFYEIAMIITTILYLPIAFLHSLLAKLFRRPKIKFKDK